jgi:hypothetical protein
MQKVTMDRMEVTKMDAEFWCENVLENDNLKNQERDGRVMLRFMLLK